MTSRTDVYEDTLRQIEELRNQAIAARTVSRAYTDYAGVIDAKSFGALADFARDDLMNLAEQRSKQWADKAVAMTTLADKLEQGIS